MYDKIIGKINKVQIPIAIIYIYSVNTFSLQSNRQIKINFDGGDLSSDAGLLLIKEFAAKIGFTKLIKKKFKPMISLSGFTKTMKTYYR